MRYCAPRGIAHSEFLKWHPAAQDAALAWLLGEGEKCGRCGTRPEEWLDENGEHVEPQPYQAVSVLCLGCEALDEKRSAVPEADAHKYHVYLKPAL